MSFLDGQATSTRAFPKNCAEMNFALKSIVGQIDSHFRVTERKSSIKSEILGGTTTFLTMSYILLVNPQILAKVGISQTDGG